MKDEDGNDVEPDYEILDDLFFDIQQFIDSEEFEKGYQVSLDLLNENIDQWQEQTQDFIQSEWID